MIYMVGIKGLTFILKTCFGRRVSPDRIRKG